jgi:radical SAM protein with 4Fe4S-binding SPASM domain
MTENQKEKQNKKSKDQLTTYGGFHPDHSELQRYFHENKVYTIQIETNLACPQCCLFCYASSGNHQNRELPDEIIKDVIRSAAKMGVKAVDWLGGDPFIRANWYELMKFASDLGLINNIWTSGLPLGDIEVAQKAVEVTEGGFISVHLDTLNEELYQELHLGDPKKKISKIITGVENLQKLGKSGEEIFNCITFTKLLAGDDVKKTIKYFFSKFGIRTCLTQMCNVGSATEHANWIPTCDEIKDAVITRDEINYPDTERSMSTMDTNKFYCGGAICITIDGDVTPCSVIRKGFGSVFNQPLEAIVEKNKDKLLYTELRTEKNLPGNCGTCNNNSICWGCRATAYYETGDINAIDPKCWLSHD